MANDFKAMADEVKPRERILAEGSASSLAGYELLAVLLKTGCAGCDVLELSRRLISAFGSIGAMIKSDLLTFRTTVERWNEAHPEKRIAGLGTVKMLELLAAFEFVRRGCAAERTAVGSLDELAAMFAAKVGTAAEQEHFLVIPLDGDNRVMRPPECLMKGAKSAVIADPREVFARALKWGASSVVVAHNHPDGDLEPSAEDLVVTRRLAESGDLLGIELMDHLILNADGEYVSLAERGMLKV